MKYLVSGIVGICILVFAASFASANQWRVESRTLGSPEEVFWEQNHHGAVMSRANGVATDDTGVYIVGHDYDHGVFNWRVEKRTEADGALLWVQNHTRPMGYAEPQSAVIDGSGLYVVGGESISGGHYWRIEKRSLIDGTILWEQSQPAGWWDDVAYGVAVDDTGVYVVGTRSGGAEWMIEKRRLTDGTLLWEQNSDPSTGTDVAYDVGVSSSGLYVVGIDSTFGNYQWRIEKRELDTGNLVWDETDNPTDGYDYLQAVAVNDFGVYVGGYEEPLSGMDSWWRIELRSPEDGHVVWEDRSNPSPDYDQLYDISLKDWGLYVVGSDHGYTNARWVTQFRSLVSGTLLWSQISDPSDYHDEAQAVAVLGDDQLFAVGYDNAPRMCPVGVLRTWVDPANDRKVCSGYTEFKTEFGFGAVVTDRTEPLTGSATFRCEGDTWASDPEPGASCTGLAIDLSALANTPVSGAVFSPAEPITFTGVVVNGIDPVTEGGAADLEIDLEGGNRDIYATNNGDPLGSFAPDDTKPLVHTVPAGEIPLGTHRYRFRVDANATLTEMDEDNNTTPWVTFTVAEPSLSGSSCVIPIGESGCWGYFSWLITGAETPNIFNSSTDEHCSDNAGGSGESCWLAYQGENGLNLIEARDGTEVLRDITVSADCSSDGIWNATDSVCAVRPRSPMIGVQANSVLTRQKGRATVEFEVTDPDNDLVCSVYGVDPVLHPDLGTFSHDPDDVTTNKTFTTRELKSTQIVQLVCTETEYGLKTTKEVRIEVIPSISEY